MCQSCPCSEYMYVEIYTSYVMRTKHKNLYKVKKRGGDKKKICVRILVVSFIHSSLKHPVLMNKGVDKPISVSVCSGISLATQNNELYWHSYIINIFAVQTWWWGLGTPNTVNASLCMAAYLQSSVRKGRQGIHRASLLTRWVITDFWVLLQDLTLRRRPMEADSWSQP